MSYILTYQNFTKFSRFLKETKTKNIKNGLFKATCFRNITQKTKLEPCVEEKFISFSDLITMKREEARRSILVQVQSAQSVKELHSYCSSMGDVKEMYHYSVGIEPWNFILVEFSTEAEANEILSSSCHHEDSQSAPTYSQFLWFRANQKRVKLKSSKSFKLTLEEGNKIIKDAELRSILKNASTISDQIVGLYNATKLNEVGTRLRFLTARQIELAFQGIFPKVAAFPFGSTVNSFGKMGCDLDLVLRFAAENKCASRLVFHCKANGIQGAHLKLMETMGDVIQQFLPGCTQIRKILQARVPIIKYYQQFTDVECDLSLANMSGVHMSDFLYVMGAIDERVRPLVLTVKKWASDVGLTNATPGRWITNFSLTLLVLAFLQKPPHSPPILPTLNTLIKLSGNKDKCVTAEGVDCTFLRNINDLPKMTTNTESLQSLLQEFFEYYTQFNFETKAICLNEAVNITKPEHSPLYIVNPLERGLNVSKNVSLEELERFKTECRNAAWILESQNDNKTDNWGLLSLFESKRKTFAFTAPRLVEVKNLFGEEEIDYKDEQIKTKVERIKKETKSKINELQEKFNR